MLNAGDAGPVDTPSPSQGSCFVPRHPDLKEFYLTQRHQFRPPAAGIFNRPQHQERGLEFLSIELLEHHANVANHVLRDHNLPSAVVVGDARFVLPNLAEVSLLYLDGSDDPAEALAQLMAAKLRDGAILVVDDCHEYDGNPFGKGSLIVPYLNDRKIAWCLRPTEPGYAALVAVIRGL